MASYLLQTLLALVIIGAFAFVLLLSAKRLGIGRPHGPIELVGALPLEGRRAVYLLRVGAKVFLVGSAEGGLSKLGELEDLELPVKAERVPSAFEEVLARLRRSKNEVGRDGTKSDDAGRPS